MVTKLFPAYFTVKIAHLRVEGEVFFEILRVTEAFTAKVTRVGIDASVHVIVPLHVEGRGKPLPTDTATTPAANNLKSKYNFA